MQKEEQRFRNLGRIDGETKLFGKNWEKNLSLELLRYDSLTTFSSLK